MEVYKITCKINNKIYIGSTKYSKEKRWGDLSSSSSHLSRVRDGVNSPLYNDIRKYGVKNFILETLEEIEGNRHYAYQRETYWIKHFWNKVGENNMYNQFNASHGNKNWIVPHTPEFQKRARAAWIKKYGNSNAIMITKEAMKKAQKTKIERYGNAGPNMSLKAKESRRQKVSNKIFDNKNKDFLIGYNEVNERLQKEGYDITYWKTRRVLEKKQCNRTLKKYPELKERFEVSCCEWRKI
jgi:group I intron endonuclease